MRTSLISRAVFTAAVATGATLAAGGIASAHVTVSAPGAAQGGDSVLTFRVPNESATNSPTVKLSVQFPALNSVDTEPIAGWTAVTTKDASDKVTDVTWTAAPGAGIAPGQFGQFAVFADDLPDSSSLRLPTVQTYADGQVVKWDQADKPDGSEPENPVPTLTLAAKQADGAAEQSDASSDTTARWLGAIGIAVGVIALAAASGLEFARRRRS